MQASNMIEMREQMLAFDSLMSGKFAQECKQLKELIAEWDKRSNIQAREKDLQVREGVLANEQTKLTQREQDIEAMAKNHDDRLDIRETDIRKLLNEAQTQSAKANADTALADANTKATEKWAAEERGKVREERRTLELEKAEVAAAKKKLADREATINEFNARLAKVS